MILLIKTIFSKNVFDVHRFFFSDVFVAESVFWRYGFVSDKAAAEGSRICCGFVRDVCCLRPRTFAKCCRDFAGILLELCPVLPGFAGSLPGFCRVLLGFCRVVAGSLPVLCWNRILPGLCRIISLEKPHFHVTSDRRT